VGSLIELQSTCRELLPLLPVQRVVLHQATESNSRPRGLAESQESGWATTEECGAQELLVSPSLTTCTFGRPRGSGGVNRTCKSITSAHWVELRCLDLLFSPGRAQRESPNRRRNWWRVLLESATTTEVTNPDHHLCARFARGIVPPIRNCEIIQYRPKKHPARMKNRLELQFLVR